MIDSIFVQFGGGGGGGAIVSTDDCYIPMDSNCAPLLADLNKDRKLAQIFNSNDSYEDDVLSLNNTCFCDYPNEFGVKYTTYTQVCFLA